MAHGYYKTLTGKSTLEVELTGQRGGPRPAEVTEQNGLDLEILTSSISRKRTPIELWLLLNTN